MSDLSEIYISVRGEVRGKHKLVPDEVNPLLQQHRKLLEQFKIEKTENDGKLSLKCWTQDVDEYNGELLDEKTLLFSHKLKINIFSPHPHTHNNYQHSLQVKIAQGLQEIRLENGGIYSAKIVIVTTGIKFSGGERTAGRWPTEKFAGIGI